MPVGLETTIRSDYVYGKGILEIGVLVDPFALRRIYPPCCDGNEDLVPLFLTQFHEASLTVRHTASEAVASSEGRSATEKIRCGGQLADLATVLGLDFDAERRQLKEAGA